MPRQPPVYAPSPGNEQSERTDTEGPRRTDSGTRPRVRPPASQVSGKILEAGIGKLDDRTIARERREDIVPPTRTRLQPLGVRDPLRGRVVAGKYRVLGLVARGGMSRVYRAEQAPLGRICALKILDMGEAPDADETRARDHVFRKRLLLEASTMAKLRHPNTVTVFDFGEVDGTVCYIAMEYLQGQTLASAIRQAGYFPEHRAVRVARQIARSLRQAHAAHIVHRDLKPANVYLVDDLDEPDFVKVFDFGLVKDISERRQEDSTLPGLFLGSPKYMPPEQFQRRSVDVRTDVYALGVVMYEMVTGRTPFEGATILSVLLAHANEPVPALRETNPEVSVSAGLEATITRALAKDPRDRFRSMGEFLAALDKLDAGPPGSRGGSARRAAAARRQRGAYLAYLMALVGVGLAIATFFALR